jgi:hypothetical protein|tara:strand:+ start:617 stop:1402 length:786 start_codon:yes stop_codon:yes gene_type:complete
MNKATRTANSVDTKKENLPMASMFEGDAHKGMEQMGADDLALPFIRILGDLSPQVKKSKAEYVEGAEPGMLFNTVSKELYDGSKGIQVVPCYYKREYIEWSDRGEGPGAPIAVHPANTDLMNQTNRDAMGKDRLPNGNYLENTASYYVMVLSDDGSAETALITMKSTGLKTSRQWNSMISGIKLQGTNGKFTPPMFSHIYHLTTVEMSNKKGTWSTWSVAKVGPVQDMGAYEQAKVFADSVSKGDVQAKHGGEESEDKVPF